MNIEDILPAGVMEGLTSKLGGTSGQEAANETSQDADATTNEGDGGTSTTTQEQVSETTTQETEGEPNPQGEESTSTEGEGTEETEDYSDVFGHDALSDISIGEEGSGDAGDSLEEAKEVKVDNTLYSTISQKYGTQIGSESELISYIDNLRSEQNSNQVPEVYSEYGLTPEVMSAVKDEVITLEEVVQGQTLIDFNSLDYKDLAHDAMLELYPDAEPGQIQEAMDDMNDANLRMMAKQYANGKNREREQLMSGIRSKMEQRQAEKQNMLAQAQQKRTEWNTKVEKSITEFNEIPGTKTKVDDQMRQVLTKALKDPQFLQKIILGDPNNPNLNHAIAQISRMAFPKQILKDLRVRAKNDATKELIDKASNIQGQGSVGKPVSSKEGVSNVKAGMAGVYDQLGLTN